MNNMDSRMPWKMVGVLKLQDGKYKNITIAESKTKRVRFDKKATLPVLGIVPIKKPQSIV